MIRIAILGATGYTAHELIRLLLKHPQAQIVRVTSRQDKPQPVADVHPELTGQTELKLIPFAVDDIVENVDCVFSCLPHAASAESLIALPQSSSLKWIDLSADYRLWNIATYEEWYQHRHPDPDRLGHIAYGLPEFYRERIQGASAVANPGCYPTSAILSMGPLLRKNIVEPSEIILDAKSGVSGAGRTPKPTTHFPECGESLSAYGVGEHRHTPEITQILSDLAGQSADVIFTPHLVPMSQGILCTGYARLRRPMQLDDILHALHEAYQQEPFVQVVERLPSTKEVRGTNFARVTARINRDRVVTVCVIDNLIKGASGAAVQNMNLMFGREETLGLK